MLNQQRQQDDLEELVSSNDSNRNMNEAIELEYKPSINSNINDCEEIAKRRIIYQSNDDSSDSSTTPSHSIALSESEISDSKMCRYCFTEVKDNYSSCACRTALCRDCLARELCLTESRQEHILKCTVCQTEYQIEYVHQFSATFCQKMKFSIKETFCCSHVNIQGNRRASIREKIALALLMIFLSLWTAATTYSICDPGIQKFSGFSAELLVYLFLVFMDWCVGFSMIWFIKLVDTLQLSLPFSLCALHVCRCVGVIIIRFVILGIEDSWKFAGCIGMLCTSMCVIAASSKLFVSTSIVGYRRIQMRNVEIMVNGKGPFRLNDIDRLNRRRNRRASRIRQRQLLGANDENGNDANIINDQQQQPHNDNDHVIEMVPLQNVDEQIEESGGNIN